MPVHLAQSFVRGRFGTYEVSHYADDLSDTITGTPAALRLTAPVVLRCGRMERGFGGGRLGWLVDLHYDDPGDVLGVYRELSDELGYYIDVTGPDGRGGHIALRLRPMEGEQEATAAPRVYPGRRVRVSASCRLAALDDVPGEPSAKVAVSDLLIRALYAAQPLRRVRAAVTLWGEEAAAPTLDTLRFVDEIAAADAEPGRKSTVRGDYGSYGKQLDTLAKAFSLTLFQPLTEYAAADKESPTNGAAGAPYSGSHVGVERAWWVVPRSRAGLAIDPATHVEGTHGPVPYTLTVSAEGIPARAYAPALWGGTEADTVGEVRRLGTVVYAAGEAAFLRDPDLLTLEPYWRRSPSDADPRALGPGEEIWQDTLAVGADPDVRVRVAVTQRPVYDAGPDTSENVGTVRIELHGIDGTVYYGPDWSTTPQVMPGIGGAVANEPLVTQEDVTTDDFPVGGRLRVVLVGDETTVTGGTYPAEFRLVSMTLEDDLGAAITEWVYRVGDGRGQTVTLPVLPEAEQSESPFDPVTAWTSAITGGTYLLAVEGTAAERGATQGRTLRAASVVLPALVGPEVRVTFGAAVPGSWTAEDVEAVAVGLEVDLQRGETRGVWVEAGEEAPPAGVTLWVVEEGDEEVEFGWTEAEWSDA